MKVRKTYSEHPLADDCGNVQEQNNQCKCVRNAVVDSLLKIADDLKQRNIRIISLIRRGKNSGYVSIDYEDSVNVCLINEQAGKHFPQIERLDLFLLKRIKIEGKTIEFQFDDGEYAEYREDKIMYFSDRQLLFRLFVAIDSTTQADSKKRPFLPEAALARSPETAAVHVTA